MERYGFEQDSLRKLLTSNKGEQERAVIREKNEVIIYLYPNELRHLKTQFHK